MVEDLVKHLKDLYYIYYSPNLWPYDKYLQIVYFMKYVMNVDVIVIKCNETRMEDLYLKCAR